ncbi:E3 ubiquitin-protein ligase MIEL1 isoform X2 [Populus alba x Populus x berolinensis]|nr:E3 ubiquitin-protein ligase MIEL1 isoform X2 [Populus alba x Populus x berolinensis]
MDAHIIGGDARLEHLVAMKSLIAGIVIMMLRMGWKLTHLIDMIFLAMKSQRLFVHSVTPNKMFQKINTIVMSVEYAELEERKISSIATNVVVVIQMLMKDAHRCVERAMHHNCPVCFEFLFDTMRDITVLPCGHTIHLECLKEMEQHYRYSCPVCSKSICDLTRLWKKLDQEIAATPMPETYQNKMVWILCNDCGANSHVQFHIVAHKCFRCNSYNTRQTRGGPAASCSSGMTEIRSRH